MARRSKRGGKGQAKVQDFVIVDVVEDLEKAREREALLKHNDIPAVIKEQTDEVTNVQGFAVMVPEEYLDEAHVVIESQDAYDDFYDFALEDEDEESDFGADFFEDEF